MLFNKRTIGLTILLLVSMSHSIKSAININLKNAARMGNLEKVKELIKGKRVDARDQEGQTLLMIAATHGHLNIVQYLVGQRAYINARDEDGETALMRTAMNGYLDVVRYLVSQGANVNATDENGKTALMWAKQRGNSDIVSYLEGLQ